MFFFSAIVKVSRNGNDYNFVFIEEELFSNPLKGFEFHLAVGQYDWSLAIKYMLNWEVSHDVRFTFVK